MTYQPIKEIREHLRWVCHNDTCGRSLKDGGCPEDDPSCRYCDMCDAHYWCEGDEEE
jgi:hypothetical protein